MAQHSGKRGAVNGQTLPFPLNESRASTFTNYDKLLGRVYDIGDRAKVMLVQANAAISPAKKALEWQDTDAFEVQLASATGDIACGFGHPEVGAVAADAYFWMICGEGARVTGVDSGSGITKGDYVQATADGDLITDAAFQAHVSCGVAISTASANGDVDIMLLGHVIGDDA